MFSRDVVDHALLMWDAEHGKIAIRPIKKRDPRSYRVTFSKAGRNAAIAAKSFCNYIEIDFGIAKHFPAKWNEGEGALEIDVSEIAKRKTKKPVELHKQPARSA